MNSGPRHQPEPVPLFLIDGHQLLYRAWFGFPARILSKDKTRDLTGVFGFLALARKAHLLHGEGHELIVVFDGENGSASRNATDPAYKANRVNADHTPIRSLAAVKNVLAVAGVAWIELDTEEADDVLATLAAHAASTRRPVTCFSGDRDLYQLLDHPDATVLTPNRTRITAAQIYQRFQVLPRQWPDYRALTGDPADNIPGIPGIGPKTAATLLADGWHLDDLPGSARIQNHRARTIVHHWDRLRGWRELIRLRTTVALPRDCLTGTPTACLPRAAQLLDAVGLW
jgi:DNA polymerase-1